MKYLSSTDIAHWADSLPAKSLLPLLIRKLVLATTAHKDIEQLEIPYGDDVQAGGYDGEMIITHGNTYVPEGVSVWEFGVTNKKKEKADKDIEKRMKDPLNKDPKATTYITVNLKKYTQKKTWMTTQRKLGFWKNVYFYDAIDIEHWLDRAPAVEIWLARMLGKPVDGMQEASDYWLDWSSNGQVQISTGLLTGSREVQLEKFLEFCYDPEEGELIIKSNTAEASLGFILAGLIGTSPNQTLASKALVIDTPEAFRQISTLTTPLLLIPSFSPEQKSIHRALQNGHKVLVPVSNSFTSTKENILALPLIKSSQFREELRKMGIDPEQANLLAKNTGKDISVLRRSLHLESKHPNWLEAAAPEVFLPLLLCARFDSAYEGDREVIAQLSGMDYEEYEKNLKRILNSDETACYHIGSKWRIVSNSDAWLYLSKYIGDQLLLQFKDQALKILKEVPEIPDKKDSSLPWTQPDKTRYSSYLKQGICESLVMLSVFSNKYGLNTTIDSEQLVNSSIEVLLETIDDNALLRLAPRLQLLAEASPFVFIQKADSLIKNGTFDAYFKEKKGFLHTSNELPYLLWALESLAWMPELLLQVTRCLCLLIQRGPEEYPTANTPFRTLKSIFRIWFPQTNAKPEQRKKVIEKIAQEFPAVTFNLLQSLVYSAHDVANMNSKMQWRLYAETREIRVTHNEFHEMRAFTLRELLGLTKKDNLQHHLTLISKLPDIPHALIPEVLECIKAYNPAESEDKNRIYHSFRELLGKHRTHQDTHWALPKKILSSIERIAKIFEPDNIIGRDGYLLESHHPIPIEGFEQIRNEYDKQNEYLRKHRINFIKKLIRIHDINKVIALGKISELPIFYGDILARIELSEVERNKLFELLASDNAKAQDLIGAYIATLEVQQDTASILKLFLKLKEEGKIATEKLGRFLLAVRPGMELFQFIEKLKDPTYEAIYWQNLNRWIPRNNSLLKFAITKFKDYERPLTALNTLAKIELDEDMPTDYILTMLQEIKLEIGKEPTFIRLDTSSLADLFRKLYGRGDADRQQMILTEYKFLLIFEEVGFGVYPQYLFDEMARDPKLFVDLIKQYYVSEKTGEIDESVENMTNEQQILMAKNAFYLLRNFNHIPGLGKENTIEKTTLKQWVEQARALAKEHDRLKVADEKIGMVLGRFPNGQKPMYFPVEIYDVLENINSDVMRRGFRIELFNRMGMTSRSPEAGGFIERNRAAIFKSLKEEVVITHPQVADIFRSLEKEFENIGREEDEAAFSTTIEN